MTGYQFIPLDRTFREVGEDEIDSDSFDSENEWDLWGDRKYIGWSDLEQRFRTVILAEGGAGKTREMQERCKALQKERKAAWFVELEMLADDNNIEELLNLDHQLPSFTHWRDLSREPAWIFLDAVDELKLKEGDFQRALSRLRASISAALDRTRIIISCRPSDWDRIDMCYFVAQLPAPRVREAASDSQSAQRLNESSEDRFLAPLKGNRRMDSNAELEHFSGGTAAQSEELKIFRLQSLARNQIEKFALTHAPDIAQAFLKALENNDRWSFARQPQDLLELLALWRDTQSLGTYKQQHEAFLLSSLREREGRPAETSQLPQQRAREGAERLSLSLALSKKRTLLNISRGAPIGSTPASVCPRELLKNWSSTDIKALLRLRTFDPPSYGRIKFHRRDIQEYLAAERLTNLAKAGNDSMRKLSALLFSKGACGEEILLPTMRGIAVWVASNSSEFGSRVRSKIIDIQPELLLADGDPEHLHISSKIAILKRIAKLHSLGTRRSLSYSPASLKRFATTELSQSITSILESGEASDSVTCLLLSLVKEGRIADCSEIVARVAMTREYASHWRILAVMGLVACEQNKYLAEIARKVLDFPQDWPSELVAEIIDQLAPTHLSIDQLKSVLEASARRVDANLNDFSQPLQQLAVKLNTRLQETAELKAVLASLILGDQLPESFHYRPLSRWSELAPALQLLCLDEGDPTIANKSKEHFFACLTAIWFQPETYYGTSKVEELVKQVSTTGIERSRLFQWELEFALNYFPSDPKKPTVVHRSLLGCFTQDDASWLEGLIKSETSDMRIRLSALLERFRLWNAQGRPRREEKTLRKLGGDGGIIDDYLNRYLARENRPVEDEKWDSIKRKQESKEEERLKAWLEWRRDILADPLGSFAGERLSRNRELMLGWLMADRGKNGSYLVWGNGNGVAAAFSDEVREAAASAFLGHWRKEEVKTFSEQGGDHSKTPYSWICALTGVSIEAKTPDWGQRLSDAEVRQATRIAMVEINGLAEYIEPLIHNRPQPVKEVLSEELTAQWAMRAEVQHLPLLNNLASGSLPLTSLMLDVAIALLLEWSCPSNLSDEAIGRVGHHLSQLIRLIQSSWGEVSQDQQCSLQNLCEVTLRADPEARFSSEWLRLVFNINPDAAIGLLEEVIGKYPGPDQKFAAVRLFAALFGDGFRSVSLHVKAGELDPTQLSRLILLAFTYVVPEEDQKRPSGISYTPNARDDAEDARSMLINHLTAIDGTLADREIDRLADSAVCSSIRAYLLSRQRMRVENKADRNYSITEISEIEERFESAPRNRDSLFRVMMARLEDLQDFLDTDDFVPSHTLRRIDSEEEMQRAIAMLLKHSSNGSYDVFREPEVKGRKRTDIQFSVPGFEAQSVIEIKVGEKPEWTVGELLHALENQLVDRYLLQKNRKAGCFLVTYGGHVSECARCGGAFKPRKKWRDPDSGKLLDFEALIERLRIRAKEIVDERKGTICLEVFGLDLRDPISREIVG